MHSPAFPILPLPQPGTGSPQHPVSPKAPDGRGQRTLRWASGTAGSCLSSCCRRLGLGFSTSCFLHGVETLRQGGRCSGEFAMADGGEKRKGQSTLPVGTGTQRPGREGGVKSQRWPACNECFSCQKCRGLSCLTYTHTPAGQEQSRSGCLFPFFLLLAFALFSL